MNSYQAFRELTPHCEENGNVVSTSNVMESKFLLEASTCTCGAERLVLEDYRENIHLKCPRCLKESWEY